MFLILQMGKLRLQEAAGAAQSHITSWSERCIPYSKAHSSLAPSGPTSAFYLGSGGDWSLRSIDSPFSSPHTAPG